MRKFLLPATLLLVTAMLAGCGSDATPSPQPRTQPPTLPTAVATTPPAPSATVIAATAEPTPTTGPAPTAVPTPTTAPTPTAAAALPTAAASSEPTATLEPAPTAELTPAPTAGPTPEILRVSRSSLAREDAPLVSAADLLTLVEGNNSFAFDLYHAISGDEGNLFFSPHSISTALAMAYAGAGGETGAQMARTLRFSLPEDRLHPAFNALDFALQSGPGADDGDAFTLNVANSVWGQNDYGFLPDYLDTLAVNYGQEVRPVDFRRDYEGARLRINDWVADETGDRIKDLIPEGALNELTRLVLANAIYFNAAWQAPFDERATGDRPFHLLDGTQREVPMMRQQSDLRYASGDGYQAVELPYVGGDAVMTILVPDAGRFAEFQDSLTGQAVRDAVGSLETRLVRLTMPRFEMESDFNLSETLKHMGMPDAFDDERANFSGMDGRLCRSRGDICLLISDVLHKAFVSVDETGTEAAAATAVIVGVTRAVQPDPDPIHLVVDRPFLFLIRDLDTGAILFLGRVILP